MLLGLDLLGRQLEGGGLRLAPGVASSVEATLAELRASIRRIVDIARDLRLFASVPVTGGERRALVDVKAAVESALSLTRGQLLERARLDVHLEDVPPVLMDEGRLGQVIVNLLVNAAQAIPGARSTEHRNAEHRIGIETRAEGRDVLIEVIDTGVGISRENAARIWEPFFTTKDRDAGTGLGLSISQQIIQRAGGTIVAESPYPGRTAGQAGARFLIRLPAAGADASEEGRSVQLPPLVCLQGGRFDVVLCDLRMPVMSGEALYKRVRARDAAQADRFVFMTGVGFGADLTRFLSESGREVLEKPFPASRALDAIARVLRQAVPGGETPKAAPEAGWCGGT
jgi:CheY-like chemotaxis protein